MFYSILLLCMHLLYTSCSKLSNLRSNVHASSATIFPVSIEPWWHLLKTEGLFTNEKMPLYGTKISSTHTSLATLANEKFSCVEHGVHGYYALIKALKCALQNKCFFKFPLKEWILVASLIDVLKKQFSPSRKFWKYKAEAITSSGKPLGTSCGPDDIDISKLAYDRYAMLKFNIANEYVNDVHLDIIAWIMYVISHANVPKRTIDNLGVDHMINLMHMLASYPSCSIQNINCNKFIRLIVDQLNHKTFSCHHVTTWLEISKLFNPDQYIDFNDPNGLRESAVKYCEKFMDWALDQTHNRLFLSTIKSDWNALIYIWLHHSYKKYFYLKKMKIMLFLKKISDYYSTATPSATGSMIGIPSDEHD